MSFTEAQQRGHSMLVYIYIYIYMYMYMKGSMTKRIMRQKLFLQDINHRSR